MRLGMKTVVGIVSILFMVALFAGFADAGSHGKVTPVVDTKFLAGHLSDVKVVFVDNWPSDKEQYMKKHVKGSVYMGIGALMGALNGGNPDQAKFEGIMHRLGINNGDHVVLYGADNDSVFTLGAFWIMEYFGHENVSFLDGGLAKWNAEGLASEGGMKKPAPGKYKAGARNESIRIDAAGVLAACCKADTAIVDARGTAQYTGAENNDKNKRVGHIPGAKDLDAVTTNFNSDHTIKSVADLKKIYESNGVTADKNVITYCQAGIKAANSYFVLKHVLGYKDVKAYIGSWADWANNQDPNKYPVEK